MKYCKILLIAIIFLFFLAIFLFQKYDKEISQYTIEKISDYRGYKNNVEISVLMPTYNRLNILPNAIESILNQDYKNFELIILDDGSNIKNWDLLFKYLIKDNRIRVYFNKQNRGRSFSRNRLFDLAKGKYLAIMDDDDTSYPNRLSEQLTYMQKHQDTDVCFSLSTFNKSKERSHFIGPSSVTEVNLFFTTPFAHPSMFLKKEFIYKNNIRYNEEYSASEDYDFYYQLFIKKANFHVLQKQLIDVRIHKTNSEKYYQERNDLFYKIRDRFQSLFFGDNKQLYKLGFCDKLKKMHELNLSLNVLKQEDIKQTIIENCDRR